MKLKRHLPIPSLFFWLSCSQFLAPSKVLGSGVLVTNLDTSVTEDVEFSIVKAPLKERHNFIYKRGSASVSPSFLKLIKEKLGDILPVTSKEGAIFQTTVLTQSTLRHEDHYEGATPGDGACGDAVAPGELAAFVVLDTNDKDAYFDHGETSIPLVKGTVLSFEGDVPHRTVLNSGKQVTLLGPFDLRRFSTVWPVRPPVGGFGDPHIGKWDGSRYDYHGECDLVMVKNEQFDAGLGLNLHIRTKIVDTWSFIESVALQIGSDVLEVTAKGVYFLNGVKRADLSQSSLSGYPVTYIKPGATKKYGKWHRFEVDLGQEELIVIKSFHIKTFMAVTVENSREAHFGDSSGLMGDYQTSELMARDGFTIHHDFNAFGQEWQVDATGSDPVLFQELRAPQYPDQQCILPPTESDAVKVGRKGRHRRRRLSEEVTQQQAESVCAHWDDRDRDLCIVDVMATGDVELAESGSY